MKFGNIFVWKFNVLEKTLFRNRHTTKTSRYFFVRNIVAKHQFSSVRRRTTSPLTSLDMAFVFAFEICNSLYKMMTNEDVMKWVMSLLHNLQIRN